MNKQIPNGFFPEQQIQNCLVWIKIILKLMADLWYFIVGYIQTPSPSDSGVCDIEAMLRDKDAEIQTLRETMANNEAVIFQVYR